MVTLLALSNMVSEQEIVSLETGNDVISFLTAAIDKAMKSAEHKEHGFHLAELVDGIATMAQSDRNKAKIMEKDILKLVEYILLNEKTKNTETLACVKLLWELSFADSIKKEIKVPVTIYVCYVFTKTTKFNKRYRTH